MAETERATVGMTVQSSDGKNVGKVVAVDRSAR